MKLGIDTCTWLKITHFGSDPVDVFRLVTEGFQIFTTEDVLRECLFHLPEKEEFFKDLELFKRLDNKFEYYRKLGFDEADASLLEYSDTEANDNPDHAYVIITEDPQMLLQNTFGSLKVIRLIDWLVQLGRQTLLEERSLARIAKRLYDTRNITKRKLKAVHQEFHHSAQVY